ncbi:hypothetical protein LA080_016035 [Diaporthe eres]|nr:hypothetical protein LA080_016035 [Diaporthe eres]
MTPRQSESLGLAGALNGLSRVLWGSYPGSNDIALDYVMKSFPERKTESRIEKQAAAASVLQILAAAVRFGRRERGRGWWMLEITTLICRVPTRMPKSISGGLSASLCLLFIAARGHRKSGQFVGLFVSLLRPFARGQQAGGFNLAITSLQCRRKVPSGLTCLTALAALAARPTVHRGLETPTEGKQSSTEYIFDQRRAIKLRMLALVVVCPIPSRVINQCT